MTTTHDSQTTSTPGSTPPSQRPVSRLAVLTHGKAETIGPALDRLDAIASAAGVELLFPEDELLKHGLGRSAAEVLDADLAIVLGGDGTMLRVLQRFLGTGIAAIGVNFGRVGFLASIEKDELDEALPHVLAGDYTVVAQPTLEVAFDGSTHTAVNDVVAASSTVGRMVQLDWSVAGEPLGRQPCDGIICATPPGSTAYNLSNGGPVLAWGLDAMAVTFIAPHSLHARTMVVPRGMDVTVRNATDDVAAAVLVDGHQVASLEPGVTATVRLGEAKALIAVRSPRSFFKRYRETFTAS